MYLTIDLHNYLCNPEMECQKILEGVKKKLSTKTLLTLGSREAANIKVFFDKVEAFSRTICFFFADRDIFIRSLKMASYSHIQ